MKSMEKSYFTGLVKKILKVLGVSAGIVLMLLFLAPFTDTNLMVNEASAAVSAGQQGNGKMLGSGQGGKVDHTTGSRSGAKGIKDAVLADEGDDDSDRPVWAGGNTDENPHSQGGGQPAGAGTKKGDVYGDLWVVVRDPETGAPELDENDNVQPILSEMVVPVLDENGNPVLDEDGNPVYTNILQLTEDGEVPVSYETYLQEVEFGRAAVARSPDKVTDKALTDALSKLTADGVLLSTDTAGRISYSLDGGVTYSTIDSPLENLTLYIDLLEGLASNATSQTESALGSLATLETAAALLAGVADKTGDISLDYVVYNNLISGVVESGDYYDYSGFSYTRDFPTDYTYFYTDGDEVKSASLNINDYLESINGELPTSSTALFAAAADDAVEVIELIHTQIHDALIVLP